MIASILDTETTGKADDAQVVDLAHMTMPDTPAEFLKADIAKMQCWQSYFGHSVPMQLGAQSTHHILPDKLKGLPLFEKRPFDGYAIGHNVDFDVGKALTGEPKAICTLALSRYLFPALDSHTQSSMMYYLAEQRGLGALWAATLLKGAHSAADDVKNCARLLKFLLMAARTAGWDISTWEAVYQLSLEARIPLFMPFGEHIGKPIADVPGSYAAWYSRQAKQDPYLIQAFRNAHLI